MKKERRTFSKEFREKATHMHHIFPKNQFEEIK
jgi:hypothetical protein